MAGVSYLLFNDAESRLEAIVDYTRERWGEEQAIAYFDGLVLRFEAIASRTIPWRAIPAEFGIEGFVCRYQRHFIYWRALGDSSVGIITILHERMHQKTSLRAAFS